MSFTVVGTSDEVLDCGCCGRTNLKMSVVLRDDEGEHVFYGRTCAARATGWRSAYLDRQVYAAQARVAQAHELVARWSRYVRPDGTVDVPAFIANNPRTLASEAEALILRVIAENTSIIDSLRREVSA